MAPTKKNPQDGFRELLDAAAKGDGAARAAICRQYEREALIVARVILGPLLRPHLDSVDIMQSVHRSLLLGLQDQKFDISSPDKLIALACTMVRRKVARKWRQHRRQTRLETGTLSRAPVLMTLSALYARDESPAQQAEANDEMSRIFAALSNVEQTMLAMRLDGYTTAEMASELKLHPVAIRVRWTRLRKRLKASGLDPALL